MWRATSCTASKSFFKHSVFPRRNLGSCNGEKVMAIRREDINVWERRSPISPAHVSDLVNQGIKVLVQPSTRRAYTMDEYERAGATISEDLTPATLIIGVKAVPVDLLLPDKTYAFFSHTIKAQEANMPLLDALLEKNIRIVDYEKMVDGKGQRVCAFGKFAGVGGMINILHGVGLRLLALGHHTPFMYMGSTHNYKSSRAAKLAAYELGEDIRSGKLPKHFGALSFVFTGSGNVSQGAQDIFKELPHMYVHPHDLKKAVEQGDHRKLIGTVVRREDYLVPKSGGKFDAAEYEAQPERYRSNFAETIAPYMSVLINGTYWAPENPRLITNDDAKNLLKPLARTSAYDGCPNLPHRLLAIGDISADTSGSLEFMTECTTIEYPFQLYDIKTGSSQIGMAGDGVLISSIDNIPAQLPREATDYFGSLLLPWIPEMIDSHATEPFEKQDHLTNTVKNAIITSNGTLTPNFKYIADLRKRMEESKSRALGPNQPVVITKRVLILGSGMTVGPAIEYLTRDKKLAVTIASNVVVEAEALAFQFRNTTPTMLDAQKNPAKLEQLIKDHDIVISMLPYENHNFVAKKCIELKTNMITSSYSHVLDPEIHEAAKEANVCIGMELGLDPGIDHMLAMECFDDVKEEEGKITSFLSHCGGLPAPECADNPLRYKFSWSPRAGLMTIMHGAKYLWYGKTVSVDPGERLLSEVRPTNQFPGFRLEEYPNRDSTVYRERYNIQTADTVVRGTFRYEGFSIAASALYQLGFYNMKEHPVFAEAREIPCHKLLSNMMGRPDAGISELTSLIYERVGRDDTKLQAMKELGLLSDEPVIPQKTAFDTLAHFLMTKLSYRDGERDVVLLRHQIGIEWPERKLETRSITMIQYGDPNGFSAMATTVGLPVGIATKQVMDGDINISGVFTPVRREIYKPLVKKLRAEGITSQSSSIFH